MVIGIGLDLVTVSRFARMIERYGERLLGRLFTAGERAYCAKYAQPAQHYAARFAAKEALLKALGVPHGLSWHELEVVSAASRAPQIHLSGRAAEAARQLGITRLLVTLTHERDLAAAMIVAEGGAD
ncbi:MAG: holo-ACP synthase [Proteobacteria bacterium]|nr:holo-ACP synthase [Pseudomonadota bacterium]